MAIEKVELLDDSSVVIDLVSESVGDGTNQEFIRWLRCLIQLSHTHHGIARVKESSVWSTPC